MINHPAKPDLTWTLAAPGDEYRVAVRNENTGEKRTVYRGPQNSCRLPSEVRNSADQWSFRVEIMLDDGGVIRHQDFVGIDRIGDDFTTPAPDLLTSAAEPVSPMFRLTIRAEGVGPKLVEFLRPTPQFLLPPGQVRPGAVWRIYRRKNNKWAGGRWDTVTKAMLDAATERAQRPVEPPAPKKRRRGAAPVDVAPVPPRYGSADTSGPAGTEPAPQFWIVMDLTADAAIATAADGKTIAQEQWIAPSGDAAAQRMLKRVKAHGRTVTIFADALAGAALEPAAFAKLLKQAEADGHQVELLIRARPWADLAPQLIANADAIDAVVEAAHGQFVKMMKRPPRIVSFADQGVTYAGLKAVSALGVEAVYVRHADLVGLPPWMRTRTTPFTALPGLVVIPGSVLVTTPAHVRDGALVHAVATADPLVASRIGSLVQMAGSQPSMGLFTVQVEPLDLIGRRFVRSPVEARRWNQALAANGGGWMKAGLERSEHGFSLASGLNEIAEELLDRTLSAIGDDMAVFRPQGEGWLGRLMARSEAMPFEPVLEMRRGTGAVKISAIRRYDAAYRAALTP
jgi:hypothetical protein